MMQRLFLGGQPLFFTPFGGLNHRGTDLLVFTAAVFILIVNYGCGGMIL